MKFMSLENASMQLFHVNVRNFPKLPKKTLYYRNTEKSPPILDKPKISLPNKRLSHGKACMHVRVVRDFGFEPKHSQRQNSQSVEPAYLFSHHTY